jgi:hypothetical protein
MADGVESSPAPKSVIPELRSTKEGISKMHEEKALEQGILDRFFQKLAASDDFPPSVLARLVQLRNEGTLQTTSEILRAFEEETSQNA